MKIRQAATLITLLFMASYSGAQVGRSVYRDQPAPNFPSDTVQGGALKEYRASPSPGVVPPAPIHRNSQSSGSSSGEAHIYRNTDPSINMRPPPVPAPELIVQSHHGVSWLCGGVGEREVNFMKNEAQHYDLMLTFAARNGDYLANVNVRVSGPNGAELMQTRCDGPIMLVDVQGDGAYRVRAEVDGYEVTRLVQVQDRMGQHRLVVMTWPMTTANMVSGPITSGGSGEPDDPMEDEDSPVD